MLPQVSSSHHTGQTSSLPSIKSFVTQISHLNKPHKVRLQLITYPCLCNIYYALSYLFCKYFVVNPLLIQFMCCTLYHTPVYAILIITPLFRIYFVLYPLLILFFFPCCESWKKATELWPHFCQGHLSKMSLENMFQWWRHCLFHENWQSPDPQRSLDLRDAKNTDAVRSAKRKKATFDWKSWVLLANF